MCCSIGEYEYPEKIENHKCYCNSDDNVTEFLSYVDCEKLECYRLKRYHIYTSILKGPTGKASNFNHFLIIDTLSKRSITFMSLSSNIDNIYSCFDSLYVDIIDYTEDVFEDDEYFTKEEAPFYILHTLLIPSDCILQTITEYKKKIKWIDVYYVKLANQILP